jgi:hypothetical protein
MKMQRGQSGIVWWMKKQQGRWGQSKQQRSGESRGSFGGSGKVGQGLFPGMGAGRVQGQSKAVSLIDDFMIDVDIIV